MAAPIPRKPARSESAPPEESVRQVPFLKVPHSFSHLFRCFHHTQCAMIYLVLERTAGAWKRTSAGPKPDRKEWAKIPIADFAEHAGCTEDGVAKALPRISFDSLCGDPTTRGSMMIESRKAGKSREYRVLEENWSAAEPRPIRSLNADPEEEEQDDEEDDQVTKVRDRETVKFTVSPGKKPKRIEFANGLKLIPEFKCNFPVAIEAGFWDDALHVIGDLTNLRPYSNTDIPHLVKNGSRKPKNICTPVRTFEELASALEPVFLNRYHRLPDEKLLSEIASNLGDCPVNGFMRTVEARLRTDTRSGTGLFPRLASDARGAWEKSRPAPTPELPQRAQIFEDESSKSLWMQIRIELKKRIPAIDYSNWLTATAYLGYSLKEGKLSVRTADEVTAQWCGEEYAAMIFEIIRELGLPVKEVVYQPARVMGAHS